MVEGCGDCEYCDTWMLDLLYGVGGKWQGQGGGREKRCTIKAPVFGTLNTAISNF